MSRAFDCLCAIANGIHTPTEIARLLKLHVAGVSCALAELRDQGFVTFERSPFDGRSRRYEITEDGRRALAKEIS
jgi:DNA-binding MarR family transcriptional regulator